MNPVQKIREIWKKIAQETLMPYMAKWIKEGEVSLNVNHILNLGNQDLISKFLKDISHGVNLPTEYEALFVELAHPLALAEYAGNRGKGRWIEIEPIVLKDPEAAYWYSIVYKDRWPEAEEIIKKSNRWDSYCLSHKMMDADTIMSQDNIPKYLLDYIRRYGLPNSDIENVFLESISDLDVQRQLDYIREYARNSNIIRWYKGEKRMIKLVCDWYSANELVDYAYFVIKGRWIEAEPAIMKFPSSIIYYVQDVVKDWWFEAEGALVEADRISKGAYGYWDQYVSNVNAIKQKRTDEIEKRNQAIDDISYAFKRLSGDC